MRRLRLLAEFGAGPIWDDDWDGQSEICPTPESLGLSPVLCAELAAWQAEYDAILNEEYPPELEIPFVGRRRLLASAGRSANDARAGRAR